LDGQRRGARPTFEEGPLPALRAASGNVYVAMERGARSRVVQILAALVMITAQSSCFQGASCHVPHSPPPEDRVCSGGWCTVQTPALGVDNQLNAIAPVSSRDMWAVGQSRPGTGLWGCPEGPPNIGAPRPLIEHFNGSSWSAVTVPTPSTPSRYGSALRAVSAASSSDVWAVGGGVIEHFDGTSWHLAGRLFAHANNKGGYGLEGVWALSRTDVWAVGGIISLRSYRPVIEHFDGQHWETVMSASGSGVLDAISGTAADDVWAVGHTGHHTLVEHFDGTRWQVTPSPDSPLAGSRGTSQLESVVTISSRNVWAVGFAFQASPPLRPRPLTMHFDGQKWRVVSSPELTGAKLLGVAADSPNDVYAVGTAGSQTLIEHFDGQAWTVIRSPNIPTVPNQLQAIGVVSGEAWAIGWHVYQDARLQALVERTVQYQ
jgi:hypothetical protein